MNMHTHTKYFRNWMPITIFPFHSTHLFICVIFVNLSCNAWIVFDLLHSPKPHYFFSPTYCQKIQNSLHSAFCFCSSIWKEKKNPTQETLCQPVSHSMLCFWNLLFIIYTQNSFRLISISQRDYQMGVKVHAPFSFSLKTFSKDYYYLDYKTRIWVKPTAFILFHLNSNTATISSNITMHTHLFAWERHFQFPIILCKERAC